MLSQTTQNRENYLELNEKIEKRFPQAEIFDTICEGNPKRQEELKDLCHARDAIVVVGGKKAATPKDP